MNIGKREIFPLSKEAIILSGNSIDSNFGVPKPMLSLGKFTLLEYQLRWLMSNKYDHIIIASDNEYTINKAFNDYVEWSVEPFNLGTGGAVLNAVDMLNGKDFYLMNVDDIVFYNTSDLTFPDCQARILVSKPKIAYGQVELRQDLVLGFKEKPYLASYVSAGHYYLKKHIVDKYFPDVGNLESEVLPRLSKERILDAFRLSGNWVTINSQRDYMVIKDAIGLPE
jgi:D-glycero-alpha-D-manno-heptose 1-phosphate guanylyltransferase